MAVLSDYTSGTITLANGSTAVTGTGTLFDVAKFREGDTLQIQNLTAVIASVNSNTSLTLTSPWTGTSLTNAPYRARYLPDGARVTAQTTTLIELLGNGVLTNLAELGVEDGKVPVGNAAGEYELADLVTDPNGTLAKFAALTLGNRQILQTDENGLLKALALAANKFLRTDANGDVSLGDITALGAALLGLTGTNGNVPVMTGTGTVASRPIVGTVSQSGGVPTGAIVERGSNANGQYVKWADGTMICTRTIIFSGNGWKTSGPTVLFAASFAAAQVPVVQLTSNPPDPGYAGIAEARYVSGNGFVLVAPAITDAGTSAFFGMTATGRWF